MSQVTISARAIREVRLQKTEGGEPRWAIFHVDGIDEPFVVYGEQARDLATCVGAVDIESSHYVTLSDGHRRAILVDRIRERHQFTPPSATAAYSL